MIQKLPRFTLYFILLFLSSLSIFAKGDVVILCYHQVEPQTSNPFSLTITQFRQQMEYLKKNGYRTLNSNELLAALDAKLPSFEKSVVISFDDGFKTVYQYAFPIMKEMGFKGIFSIYPSAISSVAQNVTWEQLKEMLDAGWSIESHSMTHPILVSKYFSKEETPFLYREIVTSREIIEKNLGNKVIFFTYPYGIYSDHIIKMVTDSGYIGGLTVDDGRNYRGISRYLLKRELIYLSDTLKDFEDKLNIAALPISEYFPQQGEMLKKLTEIRCKIDQLESNFSERYQLTAKITHRKKDYSDVDLTFDI